MRPAGTGTLRTTTDKEHHLSDSFCSMRLQFPNELVEREPGGCRVAEEVRHERPQAALVFVWGSCFRRGRSHERSDAASGLENTGSLELAIDACDRVRVDLECHGELSDRGQLVAESEAPRGNRGAQSAVELRVDGRPIARVEVDDRH